MTYTIKLQQFEGPFDLLLFFIERDELDIYDIPIATITKDFLEYVREIESLNLDIASEFILVAATLIRIKAKMLIPRKELDENNEEIDPRKELVQKLLEYKAVKDVIGDLSNMEDDQFFRVSRGNVQKEFEFLAQQALIDAEWESLTLYNLLKVFQKLLNKVNQPSGVIHKIFNYEYTIAEQQEKIKDLIKQYKKASFEQLFESCENRIHAITNFLALLDLLNIQDIKLIKGNSINQFWIQINEEIGSLPQNPTESID
ncbi:MAG: segregation/condensation protein A [Bacteroidota bacterium]|nr:segregation/condensation protein A [Bacteroidota bacterium]